MSRDSGSPPSHWFLSPRGCIDDGDAISPCGKSRGNPARKLARVLELARDGDVIHIDGGTDNDNDGDDDLNIGCCVFVIFNFRSVCFKKNVLHWFL